MKRCNWHTNNWKNWKRVFHIAIIVQVGSNEDINPANVTTFLKGTVTSISLNLLQHSLVCQLVSLFFILMFSVLWEISYLQQSRWVLFYVIKATGLFHTVLWWTVLFNMSIIFFGNEYCRWNPHKKLKHSVSLNSLEGGMVASMFLARSFVLTINFQDNSRKHRHAIKPHSKSNHSKSKYHYFLCFKRL